MTAGQKKPHGLSSSGNRTGTHNDSQPATSTDSGNGNVAGIHNNANASNSSNTVQSRVERAAAFRAQVRNEEMRRLLPETEMRYASVNDQVLF